MFNSKSLQIQEAIITWNVKQVFMLVRFYTLKNISLAPHISLLFL